MLQHSMEMPFSDPRSLVERVRGAIETLRCNRVWARTAGAHVLLGLRGDEAYARVTPLGGSSFGLAFRATAPGVKASHVNAWEPLLLVDELDGVVEHALVAVDALPG